AYIQVVGLEVVEGVERLEAELDVRPLGHGKRLVKRSREVDTARSDDRILASAAEALVRSAEPHRDRRCECGRIEPLASLLEIVGLLDLVGTICVSAVQADGIVVDGQARSLVGRDNAG